MDQGRNRQIHVLIRGFGCTPFLRPLSNNYPPAKPEVLACEPLKAVGLRAPQEGSYFFWNWPRCSTRVSSASYSGINTAYDLPSPFVWRSLWESFMTHRLSRCR